MTDTANLYYHLEMEISIVSMSYSDISRIMELERSCFPDPWSAENYISEMNNPFSVYLVYAIDGLVIAFSGLWVDEDCHLVTICTDERYRRQGIAEQLMQKNIEIAIARGGKSISLEVREKNFAARKLYEKFGFQAVGLRTAYYQDNGDNAVLYALEF